MKFNITPSEVLQQLGWKYKQKGNWLVLPHCPNCQGGEHRDIGTFAVHAMDGNFFCHRAKCGYRGTFWGLLLSIGEDPKEYLISDESYPKRPKTEKKRGYIYGV